MDSTSLHLFKQNFKFSSAHFLIFDKNSAEKLHGHNYQVRVHMKFPENEAFKQNGFFVDFNRLKQIIKARLDEWDEHVLLPGLHPEMKFTEVASSLEVRFRERFYVFPKNEVKILPVVNTSVEWLSKILAEDLLQKFRPFNVLELRVFVEETRGQGASSTVKAL